MAKIKLADSIGFYLCDHCSAVHIALLRNGKQFAEATPLDIEDVLSELKAVIAESKQRQASMASPVRH